MQNDDSKNELSGNFANLRGRSDIVLPEFLSRGKTKIYVE